MAIFDTLLSEVDSRFGLDNKAPSLLSELLALITNETRGGFTGFLDSFRRIGMGNVADSWVGSGASTSISSQQTEDALGSDTTANIANRVGIPAATATSALAFMIPQVVDGLTPSGVVPESRDILSRVGNYLTGANAVNTTKRIEPTVDTRQGAANDVESEGGSILRWLLPLLLLGLLLLVGYYACRKPNDEVKVATTATAPTNTNTSAKPAAKIDSSFSVKVENGKYILSGVVPDEATKNRIIEEAKKEFGEANVDASGLKVDANARPAGWFGKLPELFASLKDLKSGGISIIGNTLTTIGDIPKAIADKIKGLFAGLGLILPVTITGTGDDAIKAQNEAALKQLETATTPEEIVKNLNLTIIQFATGKADIDAKSQTLVDKAAEALKKVPAGTVIEVGGHTDNVGDKAKNQKLSEDRANTVRNALIKLGVAESALVAKGYGDTKPKVENTTPENKFQNRRIEYTLNSAGK